MKRSDWTLVTWKMGKTAMNINLVKTNRLSVKSIQN